MHPNPAHSPPTHGSKILRFMHLESSAGLVLIGAALLAMLVKNSMFSEFYSLFLNMRGTVSVGSLEVSKPLFLWVNDAWMAIFFFLVTMEIKREALYGYLSDRKQIVLPAIAALGGIVVPALFYVAINWGDSQALRGWAIPTATDIAFALGVLALLGKRAPVTLKVLLMTLAVLDDLTAIVIIALFYTSKLSFIALSSASVFLLGLALLNRKRVVKPAAYVLLGMALWVCVLKSGVHATLAGVITALAIPGRINPSDSDSLLESMIRKLHPWVAFLILPMFAFVNAGVTFEGMSPMGIFDPVPAGILAGLLLGKPIGIFLFSLLCIKLRLASLPAGVNWMNLFGLSVLCGIGFTMSLFVASLAFQELGIGYSRPDRLAIILGSLISGLIGYLIIFFSAKNRESI
ncbi:MAG: Na+/H+ antiporter NhaA [Gammaproteobacteria bacterium]|nr:Na+/H+ antiporter NhaA [Gammaproteobacteria bacterium]